MHGVSQLLLLMLLAISKSAIGGEGNSTAPLPSTHFRVGTIGGVVDYNSRVGKEQKVAMEMAVRDICGSACIEKNLSVRDSGGSSAATASATIELVGKRQAQAMIGTMSAQEIVVLTGIIPQIKDIPIISLASPAMSLPRILHDQLPNLLQMSNDIRFHMQCIAAIVGHFGWRKVTAIYEENDIFHPEPGIITLLSDSLELVDSEIERYMGIPYAHSLSNQEMVVEQKLEKLKNQSNRVFILVKSSLELAELIFAKAKEMRMMEKDYVWIAADEVASFLDSVDSSVIDSMQGVLGFRIHINDAADSFKQFKRRFRRKYGSKYPGEEENSSPSIFALRAYDATQAISRAMVKSEGKMTSRTLSTSIFDSNFEGLSGKIRFKNKSNTLRDSPLFDIINVNGKSYRNMAIWSPEHGFINKLENRPRTSNNTVKDFGPIYWPGGMQEKPKGWTTFDADKPLNICIPSGGAFHQFVNVIYLNDSRNEFNVSGFSIDVFKAAKLRLPYDLPYSFFPFNGTYDNMVQQVVNQQCDAAVGDTEILSGRYQSAEFSQPYLDSGVVMIVTQESERSSLVWMLKAFTPRLWLEMLTLHMVVAFVVWLIERNDDNTEFTGIGSMLWFCVTVIFYVQREHIRSNLARLVLTPWLFVILIITSSFTASLSSMMTMSRLRPSFLDIETLKATNAPVGCNGNSFIMHYLTNVLDFKQENIRRIYDRHEYPEAFRTSYIKAAFLMEPHAKVFLREYCTGFTQSGPTYKLGGLGFVFKKGTALASDMSKAILQVLEDGGIKRMEEEMLLSSNCTSSTQKNGDPMLDAGPFLGLFAISGGLAGIGFLVTVVRMRRNFHMLKSFGNALMNTTWRWPRTQF